MATLPIHIEVEDVAVGPVLIALRRMPGVIKFHVDLGEGPNQPARQPGAPKGNNAEKIMALLIKHEGGPLPVGEIIAGIGATKASVYTMLSKLKKSKAIQSPGVGQYELTAKAKAQLVPGAVKMLAAPEEKPAKANGHAKKGKITRGPGGRPSPGTGRRLLFSALYSGPLQRSEVIASLEKGGISGNSISGILERAERDKLAKSNGSGLWELTDKGRQQHASEATAAQGA